MKKTENSNLLAPQNQDKNYETLFVEIDNGQIKLPMFQREFVWGKEKSAGLIDSILKGYPIGIFIFWKTKVEMRSFRNIGNHALPSTPRGDSVQYILDGQQRITSLYAIRKGIRISSDGDEIDYRDIFINLNADLHGDDPVVVTDKPSEIQSSISVYRVLNDSLRSIGKEYSERKSDLIESYKSRLTNYIFPTTTIVNYPIEVACEIFSRVNTGGKPLSIFEIMIAKTYAEERNFDLAEKYKKLCDSATAKSLKHANYETLPPNVIMQCVSAITKRAIKGRDILKIKREDFIDNWDVTTNSLFQAVDFLRTELRVPVSHLLPYPAMLIPLTYFFNRIGNRKASSRQAALLQQFFYWVGITERYQSSSDTGIAEDLNKMDLIVDSAQLNLSLAEIQPGDISTTIFSTNAFCKTILCLLAFHQPKSFDTNGVVLLDNSNLKIASSRNYHHFFPKAYLGSSANPNLIANITLIDGYSNKHKIGKKPPSIYLKSFISENSQFSSSLASHLIYDLSEFGVLEDSYEKFIEARSKAIANALNKKLFIES